MSFEILGYNITDDPAFLPMLQEIPPGLADKLQGYYELAVEGKRSSIPILWDAIEQYPEEPQLKNFLSVLYRQLNQVDKMYEINRRLVREHPDYLFGKVNLALEHYVNQQYHKMPEILGKAMEIKALYPNRDTFHIKEVLSMYKCAVLYFSAIGSLEQAETRYKMMYEIAPDSEDTEDALRHLLACKLEVMHAAEQEQNITVELNPQKITTMTEAPQFHHQEINWLYTNGLHIAEEKLQAILALPVDTLVQDLELVLQDSIERFAYFDQLAEERGWDEEKLNFPNHALFLLGELQAKQSLPTIFEVFAQSEIYLELYFGDFLVEALWEVVYKIAANDLEACKQFIFRPAVYTYARTLVFEVVEQVVWHQPERRNEAIAWYRQVLQFFLDSRIEDNVIDSDVIGSAICFILDIEAKELMPEIKELYDRGLVSTMYCGDWKAVKKSFAEPYRYDKKRQILPIAERYKEITSTWAGYQPEETNIRHEPIIVPSRPDRQYTEVRTEPKIGRNEPCPCGSGKKYKKCCLNK